MKKLRSLFGKRGCGEKKRSRSLDLTRNRRLLAEVLEPRAMLAADLVGIRLQALDTLGRPIASIDVNQTFIVQAFVDDLRSGSEARGVSSAFLDLRFNRNVVQALEGSFQYNTDYNFDRTAVDVAAANLTGTFEEVGAFWDPAKLVPPNQQLPGPNEVLLFSVRFKATASGIIHFDANAAEDPDHRVTLIGRSTTSPVVANEDVRYRDIRNFAAGNAPKLSVGNATISEGNSGTKEVTVTVNRTDGVTDPVTVKYRTINGTATAGSDYTATEGELTFAAGETQKTISLTVSGDTANEGDENFLVELFQPEGAAIVNSRGIVTITNDDGPPTLTISDATIAEGNDGTATATFTVSLTSASTQPVTVKYRTTDATAKAEQTGVTTPGQNDYEAASGTLTFAAGETTKTISVIVNGDRLNEDSETFTVTLSDATGVAISDTTGLGTITNDDALPTLRIADVVIEEGDGETKNAIVILRLNARAGRNVSVAYATANGSASSASDYTARTGTLTFTPGQTRQTISIPISGDFDDESDEEFFVNLSSIVNATFRNNDTQGKVTITDEDVAGELGAGSVSGFAYIDVNNDGIKSASEQPIRGVTVALSGKDFSGANVSMTTTTASDGSYRFNNLKPGDYVVKQTQPTRLMDGRDTIGSQGGTVANDQLTLKLANRQDGTGNNFGERGRFSSAISRADFFIPPASNSSLTATTSAIDAALTSRTAAATASTGGELVDSSTAARTASRASFFVPQPYSDSSAASSKSRNLASWDEIFGQDAWGN